MTNLYALQPYIPAKHYCM